jgi:hypothetical protein
LYVRITLKELHRLWHEGIHDLRIRPLKSIQGRHLREKDAKAATRARGIIQEIEKYLDQSYWQQTQARRDQLFNGAFNQFEQFLEPIARTKRGFGTTLNLSTLSYCSLYENYFLPAKRIATQNRDV